MTRSYPFMPSTKPDRPVNGPPVKLYAVAS